ncbi:MAG: RNA 2',3'-cyclic phosphodiesterase [Patescibacteria group bacterium]
MRHRVFIAINLPENVKKELNSYQFKWPELPIKWTKKDNLHITLVFLGYLREEELVDILKITNNIILKHEPFFIRLKKICYGPSDKKPPRMIWVESEKSERLGKLQRDLTNSLSGFSSNPKTESGKNYTSHITLGRLKQWEFRSIEPEERPWISEEIDLSFEVNSIDIMESHLKKGGPKYTILESLSFPE